MQCIKKKVYVKAGLYNTKYIIKKLQVISKACLALLVERVYTICRFFFKPRPLKISSTDLNVRCWLVERVF